MKKLLKTKLFPIFLLFISFIVLLFKARYSFCFSDEPFYLATAARFYNGDSIFFHEWFPTQLSSLLLVPIYSLFVSVKGSTEGIVLFFRILYVFFEFFCSVVVFHIISKHHEHYLGTAIALLNQWYVHLNIATLSYYTMTIQFFLLAMLILYDCYMNEDRINAISSGYIKYEKSRIKLMIAGFVFALSVLCLPTLCIVYFAVLFFGLFISVISKPLNKVTLLKAFSNKLDFIYVFKYTLIGIIIPACVFMIYLLTHVSLEKFILSIPYVLSDDEHITSFIYPIKKMYLAIDESFGRLSKLIYIFTLICVFVFAIIIIAKYTKNVSLKAKLSNMLFMIKPIIFSVDIILFSLCFIKCIGHTGYIFTALIMFSLPLFLITENKNYILFILTVLSGIIYSLTYSYSSNGMLYVLAMGHYIASVGGIILTKDFISEIDKNRSGYKRCATAIISAVIIIALFQTVYLRMVNVYRDDKLVNLTETIDRGPAKGLRTSKDHLSMYDSLYDSISEYCMSSSGNDYNNLLISKLLPVGYLISDLKVAAPSVWRNPMNSERLKSYYVFTENREPDVIFVLSDECGSYETCGDVEKDSTPNENDKDGFMYDYINKNGFTKISVPYGVIYQKP